MPGGLGDLGPTRRPTVVALPEVSGRSNVTALGPERSGYDKGPQPPGGDQVVTRAAIRSLPHGIRVCTQPSRLSPVPSGRRKARLISGRPDGANVTVWKSAKPKSTIVTGKNPNRNVSLPYVSREKARTVECPRCRAVPGSPCMKLLAPRVANHQERVAHYLSLRGRTLGTTG